MPNANNDPVELIKRAALGAVEASKLVSVSFGTVVSAAPVQIQVEQKLTLGEKQLILTRAVTDHTVMMTVDHQTEPHSHTHAITDTYSGGGKASTEAHSHGYRGKKAFVVHSALQVGETVLLLRVQGGQKYLVLDRLGAME